MSVNLLTARKMIDVALDTATEMRLKPLAIAVLDPRGCLVAFAAQDGTSLMRDEVARAKAYGALALGMGSRAIFKRAQEQAFFVDAVNTLARGAIVPVPGGVLVRAVDGTLLGAIGISGDTSDNDEVCALAAIAAADFVADTG